eukprot:evm.model.scf_22.6 EVM.evm.TU.scf_22.6   scf_22:77958-79588(-)
MMPHFFLLFVLLGTPPSAMSLVSTTSSIEDGGTARIESLIQSPEGPPYLVQLKASAHGDICPGIVISQQLVLTTATCIERAGPRPSVVLSGLNWSLGGSPVIQEQKAEWAKIHPRWQASAAGDCCNAALVKLPERVDTIAPVLADQAYRTHTSQVFHGIAMLNSTTSHLALWTVANPRVCQGHLSQEDGTFCLLTQSAPPVPVSAGVMAMTLYNVSMENGPFRSLSYLDLLVGLCVQNNFSLGKEVSIPRSTKNHVIKCASIGSIRDWVEQYKSQRLEGDFQGRSRQRGTWS